MKRVCRLPMHEWEKIIRCHAIFQFAISLQRVYFIGLQSRRRRCTAKWKGKKWGLLRAHILFIKLIHMLFSFLYFFFLFVISALKWLGILFWVHVCIFIDYMISAVVRAFERCHGCCCSVRRFVCNAFVYIEIMRSRTSRVFVYPSISSESNIYDCRAFNGNNNN